MDSGLSERQLADLRDEVTHVLDTHVSKTRVYDDCDVRLYGADRVSLKLCEVFWWSRVRAVLSDYQPDAVTDGFALAARIRHREGNFGSGGGWHRDSFAGVQVKAILYLTDTTMENGPFEYLAGSHRSHDKVRRAWQSYRENRRPAECRFDDGSFDAAFEADPMRQTFVGQAGTLILVNTTGIHRGRPLRSGERMAITNYYLPDVPPALAEKFSLPPRPLESS